MTVRAYYFRLPYQYGIDINTAFEGDWKEYTRRLCWLTYDVALSVAEQFEVEAELITEGDDQYWKLYIVFETASQGVLFKMRMPPGNPENGYWFQ